MAQAEHIQVEYTPTWLRQHDVRTPRSDVRTDDCDPGGRMAKK